MTKRLRLLLTRSLAPMALLSLLVATPVFAQINDPSVKDGNIEKAAGKQPVLEYALAGGFLIAALAIGFKPAKRSEE